MTKSETLNAIRLNLIVLNVSTSALHLNLEHKIKQNDLNNNPNCIKEFLDRKYDYYRTNHHLRIQSTLQPLLKKLNPNHPRGNPNSPNELKLFDVSACYLIAKEFLHLPAQHLQLFEELRVIRNDYIAHLSCLHIEDSVYLTKLQDLKRITGELSNLNPNLKQEFLENIEKIEHIKDFAYFDTADINKYIEFVINLLKANKENFNHVESIRDEITKLVNQFQENLINNKINWNEIFADFENLFNIIQQTRQSGNDIIIKAIEELDFEQLNDKLDTINDKVSLLDKKFDEKFDNLNGFTISSLEKLPDVVKNFESKNLRIKFLKISNLLFSSLYSISII